MAYKKGNTMAEVVVDQSTVTWDGITDQQIKQELARFRHQYPKERSCWMVPAQFPEGDKTPSACVSFPYSNVQRRHYISMNSRWEQSFW